MSTKWSVLNNYFSIFINDKKIKVLYSFRCHKEGIITHTTGEYSFLHYFIISNTTEEYSFLHYFIINHTTEELIYSTILL